MEGAFHGGCDPDGRRLAYGDDRSADRRLKGSQWTGASVAIGKARSPKASRGSLKTLNGPSTNSGITRQIVVSRSSIVQILCQRRNVAQSLDIGGIGSLTMPAQFGESVAEVSPMKERFDRLNETQKRLLREVAKGRSSKTMSRDVGLEPGTIDVYLSQALKTLAMRDRRTAAEAFVAHEATILNLSILRPEALASADDSPQSDWRRKTITLLRWIRLPPVGGRSHNYDLQERMIAAFKVAGSGFVLIISLAMAMTALFWAFSKN